MGIIMDKIGVVYFSGTGNTKFIAKIIKRELEIYNKEVDLINIEKDNINLKEYHSIILTPCLYLCQIIFITSYLKKH